MIIVQVDFPLKERFVPYILSCFLKGSNHLLSSVNSLLVLGMVNSSVQKSPIKKEKIYPWKSTWNTKMKVWFRSFPFSTCDFQVHCQFLQDTSRSFHKSPPLSPFYHIIIYTIVWQTSFYHIATLLHAKIKSLYILEFSQKQDTNTRKQWNPTHDNDQKQDHYDYDNTICDHNSYIRMFPHFNIFSPQVHPALHEKKGHLSPKLPRWKRVAAPW